MKQPGSMLEVIPEKLALTPRIIWSRGEGASLLPGPTRGVRSQTSFNGSKKEKGFKVTRRWIALEETAALPLPCIPRHWSQWSHKWLLTLTVNGYKKTPSFLYMTRSPLLGGFVDGSRGCCEQRGWRKTVEGGRAPNALSKREETCSLW